MENDAIKRLIEDIVDQEIKDQLGGGLFTLRKTTDTPPDSLSVVNRKYVTLNGPSTTRPTSSITGQFYFDTTIRKPIWWRGDAFVDGAGNVV